MAAARKKRAPAWRPRQVRWLAGCAALSPLLLVGLGVLGTGSGWFPPAFVLGVPAVVLVICPVLALLTRGWVLFAALFAALVIAYGSGAVFEAGLMDARGLRTEVAVTRVTERHGKDGRPYYECRVRRVDGRPMGGASIVGMGCTAWSGPGDRLELLVDPGGWLDPEPPGTGSGRLGWGAAAVATALVLFELLVLHGFRVAAREAREPVVPVPAARVRDNRSRKKRPRR